MQTQNRTIYFKTISICLPVQQRAVLLHNLGVKRGLHRRAGFRTVALAGYLSLSVLVNAVYEYKQVTCHLSSFLGATTMQSKKVSL